MRGISESAIIKRPLREIWDSASDPARWSTLAQDLGGRTFSCRVEAPGGRPAIGSEVVIVRANGREEARGRITRWEPPNCLAITLQHAGWMTAYHGTLTIRLSELDDELTSAELAVSFVLMNRMVEVLSLLLPVGPLYRRAARKTLARLGAAGR